MLEPSLLVTASATVQLSGCPTSGDVIARIAPTPWSGSLTEAAGPAMAMATPGGPGSSNVVVSPRRHATAQYIRPATARLC